MERWLPIAGYEEIYSVSDLGRVRIEISRRGFPAGSMLALTPGKDDYLQVSLARRTTHRKYVVSRLVLTAYARSPRPGEQANHKNGDIADNRLENLEWSTALQNIHHAIEVLGRDYRGEQNPASKLTEQDVIDLRDRAAKGVTQMSLSRTFGISNVMARNIASGRSWAHVGGPRTTEWLRGRPKRA